MSGHDHGPEMFDAAFWDARYSSAHSLWSGNPNRQLVTEAAGLEPGTALDAGAGEGADAIWLAERGWQVTAVDVSGVALGRAAEHAAKAGDEVAARIRWQREDLREWIPPERAYDLVTSQYLHLPGALRRTFFAGLAAAVRDGGTLLIVGHHPMDLDTTLQRPNHPELMFTGDELARDLGGDGWEIVTNVAAEREATDPDGRPVTAHDTVFRARRV
ncbi:MAG TPA: class I SAM-dependent methyltransferase [Trebonia sp.]|nr:class I SAM-dependent methyltransferase [Trebonia sp.]